VDLKDAIGLASVAGSLVAVIGCGAATGRVFRWLREGGGLG
jgi:hypothetical protein